MATYAELYNLQSDSALRNRVTVACTIAANTVRAEDPGTTNHANRLLWAKQVFERPEYEGERMLRSLLAQNASATVAQIEAATDTAIQTAVNNTVDIFAIGATA